MDRVGGPVGCSTASIGCWILLGLLEFDPQELPVCNNVCNCSGHSKGVGFELGRVYPTGECVGFDTDELSFR